MSTIPQHDISMVQRLELLLPTRCTFSAANRNFDAAAYGHGSAVITSQSRCRVNGALRRHEHRVHRGHIIITSQNKNTRHRELLQTTTHSLYDRTASHRRRVWATNGGAVPCDRDSTR
jgi:hypothetical protein